MFLHVKRHIVWWGWTCFNHILLNYINNSFPCDRGQQMPSCASFSLLIIFCVVIYSFKSLFIVLTFQGIYLINFLFQRGLCELKLDLIVSALDNSISLRDIKITSFKYQTKTSEPLISLVFLFWFLAIFEFLLFLPFC